MTDPLVCWQCGASLDGLPLPLARESECRTCRAQLHVCRLCAHYNLRVSEKCDEPNGEHPREADRANFCDWFTPAPDVYQAESEYGKANNALKALFGEGPPKGEETEPDKARNRFEDLFGSKDD